MKDNIDNLIDERQKLHGEFSEYAKTDQLLKSAMTNDFRKLAPNYITSGLDMIASKMARIITGDAEELDHWKDIQGYSRAVERCIKKPIVSADQLPSIETSRLKRYDDLKIQTYNDMTVETVDPNFTRGKLDRIKIQLACDLTMKRVTGDYDLHEASKDLIERLYDAEHVSVFDHCNITFLARGISRSLLAQVTRQGTFRFTSASQHYQDYRDYPFSLHPDWDSTPEKANAYRCSIGYSLDQYKWLIECGEKPEEARQVLSPAATVNLEITANARNLTRFFRQRLCRRNVTEMLIFANKLKEQCMLWLPELFSLVGAPCATDGKCNQGKMACGKPFVRIER